MTFSVIQDGVQDNCYVLNIYITLQTLWIWILLQSRMKIKNNIDSKTSTQAALLVGSVNVFS